MGVILEMERKALAKEIVDFCVEYGIFNISSTEIKEITRRIRYQLDDYEFVENLINMIIVRTKVIDDIDTVKLKKLLIELEKTRLELEYNAK